MSQGIPGNVGNLAAVLALKMVVGVNIGVVTALEQRLKHAVAVPDQAQLIGAIGAARLAVG